MKKNTLKLLLVKKGMPFALLLALATGSHAATLYWDSPPVTADGVSQGGAGTWDTITANWDNGSIYQVWNATETAEFAGSTGTITIDAGGITAGGLNVEGGYTFTGGALTTSGVLNKTGGGTMLIRNNNNITGNIVISGGVLQLGNNNDTGSFNGGSFAGDISIASGSTFRDRSSNSVTMSGVISGDGNLHQDGSGTMTLTGANTYTGQTIIRASGAGGPTLSVSSLNSVTSPAQQPSSSLGVPADEAAGTILLGSGTNVRNCTLIYTGAGETTDRIMNVSFNSGADQEIRNNGSGLLKFTSTFIINRSSGNNGGRFTLGGSSDGEIEAGTSGGIIPGDLWKDDAGTWTLGGTTTADDLRVAAGTLVIAAGGTLDSTDFDTGDGATGAVSITGGTLTVNGLLKFVTGSVTGGALDGTGTLNYDVDGTTIDQFTMSSGSIDISGLSVDVTEDGAGLTEAEYILVDATGGGTLTGTFTGVTGATGYVLDYGTPNQVKLVQSGGGAPYDTWSGTFGGLSDPNPELDFDGGSLDTGLEWVLGGDPTDASDDLSIAPTGDNSDATYFTFTFHRDDDANADGNTTIEVEYGNDLTGWTTATHNGGTIIVTENDDAIAAGIDEVVVQIDKSLAGGTEMFVRLKVTVSTP